MLVWIFISDVQHFGELHVQGTPPISSRRSLFSSLTWVSVVHGGLGSGHLSFLIAANQSLFRNSWLFILGKARAKHKGTDQRGYIFGQSGYLTRHQTRSRTM